MKRTEPKNWSRPTVWFLILVGLSALVGIRNAQVRRGVAISPPRQIASRQVVAEKSLPLEKIESTLAQAGCPGWMVLASEGEAALRPPADSVLTLVPGDVKKTSLHIQGNVPRVTYPAPIRVASRTLFAAPATNTDDLLDGVPDLLETPDGSPPAQETIPTGPPIQPAPTEQPKSIQAPKAAPIKRQPPKKSPFAPPPTPKQPTPHSSSKNKSTAATDKKTTQKTTQSNCEFIAETQFPSAQACAKCHEKIYDEWSVSSHAYAMVSPMFHKFEQTINNLSQGTSGYFCYRCHSPAGVTLGISRAAPLWELPLVAREGITCVACHRVNQRYGKANGERRLEPGDIHSPVYGPIGGSGVAEVIAQKEKYKVKTSPDEKGPGQDIHTAGIGFDQLSKAEFCVSCHQVAVQPGVKLEVVWEQYRASPACKKGISCQDCHMGRIPGVPSGYEVGAAAEVNKKTVNKQRKHANHTFYGPGYSIAHPGVFPFNIDANRWTMQQWLQFDWRAGWGTEKFEEQLEDGEIQASFPEIWAEADDRYDARDVIDDNLKKLDKKKISRMQVMENGSHVDGPFFDTQLTRGQDLRFHYVMTNTNEGHNLPSGSLGAQPQLWANVVLVGPGGQRLWESGYTDRWGDVADIHSTEVQAKRIPFDWQLFNLQTMFLITGAKGTDREFYLPVNFDIDQLPYLRPGAQPISVLNHPPFIRMEGRSLPALGSRNIPYKVPAELMCEPGHYRLSFRLRSRLEPIYFMRFCGSTDEMIRSMNEGMLDFHQSSVEFIVK